jgi:tetratricopeptide (TPR) repeat protein
MIKVISNYLKNRESIDDKSRDLINRMSSAIAIQTTILVKEGKNQDAISSSADFLSKYDQCKPEYKMTVLLKRVEAFCGTDDYDGAKKEFVKLESIFKEEKIMKKNYDAAMITLANCAKRLAEKITDQKQKEYYNEEFVKYYLEYSGSASGGDLAAGSDEVIFNITNLQYALFEEKLPKTVFHAYDESLVGDARKIRETYMKLLESPDSGKDKKRQGILEFRIGICCLIDGRYDDAERYYGKATAPGKFENDPDLEIFKADFLVKKALAEKSADKRNPILQQAITQYGKVVIAFNPLKEPYHRALYSSLRALWETGRYEDFKNSYQVNKKALGDGVWDNNDFGYKPLYEELEKYITGYDPRKK